MTEAKPISSFISFDVEALPGRAADNLLEQLVWGKLGSGEYGIRRLSKILSMHKLKGNFLVDFAMCLLYGDKAVKQVVQFLLEEGHEVHAHLHSEWVIRKWGIDGPWKGPLGMDRIDQPLSDSLMDYTAWKYRSLTGLSPSVFRAGGYLFSDKTLIAAKRSGFQVLSNYNSSRHGWTLPECAAHNAPFRWDNRLLELPVDFSPEPLSFDWTKYTGWYERARTRKTEKTFNLVLHSWSLLKRNGEYFDAYSAEHEERLHQICEHLSKHTNVLGYTEYVEQRSAETERLPTIDTSLCTLPMVEVTTPFTACNLCGYAFTKVPEVDTCPGCGARARHRQLKDAFQRIGDPFRGKTVLANYANVVEVQGFLQGARALLNFDVRPVSEVELQMDIQNMSMVRTGSIDTFWAVHVLNHVEDDERALREISRVLKPGGLACLTIPYREGYPTTALSDTTEHYGREALDKYAVGTFRRYGLSDALTLFRKYFDVETESGFDPVTCQSMLIFLLKKRTSSHKSAAAT